MSCQPTSGVKRKRLESAKRAETQNPADLVHRIYEEHGWKVEPSREKHYFVKVTPEMIEAYDKEILRAVREKNLEKLKGLHQQGRVLQCCNRFGESLLHMACRNGLTDIVKFLVKEAKVSLHVRDDYGRTPFHDACWTVEPNFALVEFLIQEAPELVGLSDVRGHTPFSYVRKNHWKQWVEFLNERKAMLLERKEPKLG